MDPLTIILGLGTSIIERLFPDPAQAAQAKLKLLELQQSGELAQMTAQTEINKVEASSNSVFVSGWRPFLGWICGSAFAWNFIGFPIAVFVSSYFGHPVTINHADMSEMLPVLLGMLGLGGLRTYEKTKGVASK